MASSQPNALIPKATLKNKVGRLSVFARGNSDSQAHYNASAPDHEAPKPRSQSPNPTASAAHQLLTRQEIADSARIAVPQSSRNHPAPLSPRKVQVAYSPQKVASQSPPVRQVGAHSPESLVPSEEEEERRTLFEGSQLGDHFMASGLTTPQNEPDDVYVERVVEKPSDPYPRKDESKDARYSRPDQGSDPKNRFYFQVTEGGKFAVGSGNGRRSPSRMRDGFQKDVFNEPRGGRENDHYRPASPANAAKNLPIREVKIRRALKPANNSNNNRTSRDDPHIQNLAATNPRWPIAYKEVPQETSMAINLDGEEEDAKEEENGDEEQEHIHETPKASRDAQGTRGKALLESSMPPMMNLGSTKHLAKSQKRGRASPDYDDQALSSMSATALQDEPFDWDPANAVGHSNGGDAASLTEKLEQFSRQSEREQRAFFATMSMDDWEESGDWFVDQFSTLMTKLRDARRDKRRTIQNFEKEAFSREEAVRRRSEAIDRKLGKMRQDGQRVVGDRYF